MKPCVDCGSWAVNPHMHGRDDTRLDLCDVCYWRTKAEEWRRDAERYRWVRQFHGARAGKQTATVVLWLDEPFEPEGPEQLDAAIDAARKEGV